MIGQKDNTICVAVPLPTLLYNTAFLACISISLLAVSCDDMLIGSMGSADEQNPVVVSSRLFDPDKPDLSVNDFSITDFLEIDAVHINYGKINIDNEGSEPFAFLLPDSVVLSIQNFDQKTSEIMLPDGIFERIGIEIASNSIKILGRYEGDPFEYVFDESVSLSFLFEPALDFRGNTDSLTVIGILFAYKGWFKGEKGEILDPRDEINRPVIDENILNSISIDFGKGTPDDFMDGDENGDEAGAGNENGEKDDSKEDQLLLTIHDTIVAEGDGVAYINITLFPASTDQVSVDYKTADGEAESGKDYSSSEGSLLFEAGETVKTISVPIADDNEPESATETFFVNLLRATNATIEDSTGTVVITDDDSIVDEIYMPSISISNVVGLESDGQMVFTVKLDSAASQEVSVDYTMDAVLAQPGDDFSLASGTLNFLPGQTGKTIPVSIVDDLINEADETLTVSLSNPVNATLGDAEATGTIIDNDPVSISITDPFALESAGELSFAVSLSIPSEQIITVDYTTADGTATLAGEDYTSQSGTLTFSPGETGKTISISLTDNLINEATETFKVRLANPGPSADINIADPEGIGTVTDDDPVTISIADAKGGSVLEGNDLNFEVTLSVSSDQTIQVAYASSDGSATAGDDYTAQAGTLTFRPGTVSQTIVLNTIDDLLGALVSLLEFEYEDLFIDLSSPVNATIEDGQARGEIIDNDI